MPSQSRAFEASLESSGKQQVPHGTDPERMLEDFDTFFEKINSLEQAEWRHAHPANPQRPAAQPARNKAAFKPDPLAGLRAAVAEARHSGAAPGGRTGRRRVAGSIRFALLALLLFAVGMGLGWAALSLPGRTGSDAAAPALTGAADPAPPAEAKGMQDPKGAASTAAPGAAAESKTSAATPNEVLLSENPGHAGEAMATSTSGSQAGHDARTAPPLFAQTAPVVGTPGEAAPSAKRTRALAGAPKPSVSAHSPKAARGAKANPSAAPAQPEGQGAVGTAASGAARYAVQVGACRSPRCVDGYRELVAAHMQPGNDSAHIMTVPAEGKDASVQRVRVAPLEKAEALRLKDALVQSDPRLRGAYVVELR